MTLCDHTFGSLRALRLVGLSHVVRSGCNSSEIVLLVCVRIIRPQGPLLFISVDDSHDFVPRCR